MTNMNSLKNKPARIPTYLKHIFVLFVGTRLSLTMIGVVSRMLLEPFYQKRDAWVYSEEPWLDLWAVFDSGWYMNIAKLGYSTTVATDPASFGKVNYSFFPLYPLLIRFVSEFTDDLYLAGIIISNISLIAASIFLFKLMKMEHDEDTSLASIKYLFIFPTSFIFSGVFTESLFLALTLACFYYARRGKFLAVGIVGFFLSLTRIPGVIIILPMLWEYQRGSRKLFTKDLVYLMLIPLGLVT